MIPDWVRILGVVIIVVPIFVAFAFLIIGALVEYWEGI